VYDISSIPEVLLGLFHLLVKTRDVEQTSMELCPNPPTSPDSGFLKLKCPVPKNYWFLPRSIQKRQQLDDFWGALQEPLDVWNGCREAQHGQTASASTPFPAPLEVEIM
jgi:hypothetical protein